MKIVLIHGQNHRGSTCMIARQVAEKVKGRAQGETEVREFFLPEAFDEPCRGCYACFRGDLTKCPHYAKLEPLAEAMLEADLLILLSDIDGLYTADPRRDPQARLMPVVEALTPEVMALAGGNGSALGTGGMVTKLRAAKLVTQEGIDMVIANGEQPEIIYQILDGAPVGTRFIGRKTK